MSSNPTLPDCERCGHGPDWHRLDDTLNVSPDDPAAQFRCLGVDLGGCADRCPEYVCSELAKAVFAVKAAHPEVVTAEQMAQLLPEHLRGEYWASKVDEYVARGLLADRGPAQGPDARPPSRPNPGDLTMQWENFIVSADLVDGQPAIGLTCLGQHTVATAWPLLTGRATDELNLDELRGVAARHWEEFHEDE
jgi:hypothetical protein